MSNSFGVSAALGPSSKVIAMYGPSTWTELNVIPDSAAGPRLSRSASCAGTADSARNSCTISPARQKRSTRQTDISVIGTELNAYLAEVASYAGRGHGRRQADE